MPNHPRLAISSEKARSGAAIQVSSVRDALAAAVRPTSRASACSSSSSGERAKSMPGNLPPTRSRAGVGAPSGEEDELAELPDGCEGLVGAGRSEAHTSELPSLMRSSYAGLCLKTTPNDNVHC